MTDKDNGGPAFPFAATDPSNVPMQAAGMSLRDWFAGKALQGFLANEYPEGMVKSLTGQNGLGHACYIVADAMLAARKGEQP